MVAWVVLHFKCTMLATTRCQTYRAPLEVETPVLEDHFK